MRSTSWVLGLLAVAAGAVLTWMGWQGQDDSLTQTGGATLVAGLALIGVSAGISTWRDERRLQTEKERQDATGQLVYQLLARFAGVPWDGQVEAELRAKVAVWGHVEVVEKLRAWHEVFGRYIPHDLPPNTTIALSSKAQEEFRRATAEVARAVRRQFNPADAATVEQLEGALFNVAGPKDE